MNNIYIFSFILFCIWVVSSYLWTFVSGWTSSLSVGLMILIWIPPQITKATYQFWLFGWSIAWIKNFIKSGHIPKKFIIGSMVATFLWWMIWGNLMVLTPNSLLQKLTGWIFLIFLCITFLRKYFFSNRSIRPIIHISKLREYSTYIGQFFLSILSWYIPWAAGSLYFILYTELLHISTLQYKSLWRFTWIALVLGTLYPIIKAGLIDMRYVVPFFIWMYIGWHFWSKHLINVWETFAQYVVYISVFFLALYLIFS